MKATQSDRRQEFSTLSDYYSDNEHPNGLDYKQVNKIAKYREAITKLQRRCECLSQNNERLVRRFVHQISSFSFFFLKNGFNQLAAAKHCLLQVTICEANNNAKEAGC